MDGDGLPKLTSKIEIPFYTEKEAEIAYNSLRVDKEPPRGGCTKDMSVKGLYTNLFIFIQVWSQIVNICYCQN